MRVINKLLGATAALVLSAGFAAPASALTPLGSFSVTTDTNFVASTTPAFGGSLSSTGAVGPFAMLFGNSMFNYDPSVTGSPVIGAAEFANFTLNATSSAVATSDNGSTPGAFVQLGGFSGSFSLIYTGVGGFPLPPCLGGACNNLLSATFSGGTLTGHVGASHAELSDGTQLVFQNVVFSSDFYNFAPITQEAFSVTLNSFSNPLSYTNGRLGNFTAANASGVASVGTGAVVPEPGTWGLMIVGFGGAGAMLRSRRRVAAAAA